MDDLHGVAEVLARAGRTALPFAPEPVALTSHGVRQAVAVDGSHGVLVDNGAVWVVALSAASACWPGPRPLEAPVTLVATLPDEAEAHVEARASSLGLPAPGRIQGAEAFAEALRGLLEVEAACRAAASLGPEDLLLVDGALRGLPSREQAWVDRIRDAASRREVPLVGVAKRSGLGAGGVPLVPRLHAAVRMPGPWAVPVPDQEDVWVARLHARSPFSFRVDAPAEALGALVPLARDAAYIGYPYPLAVAHNAVALTAGRLATQRRRLDAALRRRGGHGLAWLDDFHDVLDRNVPG